MKSFILLDLHGHGREILAGGKVCGYAGSNYHQKKDKNDQRKADSDNTPIVKEMKLDFASAYFGRIRCILHENNLEVENVVEILKKTNAENGFIR